jgi:hypothetical protein
MNSCSEYPLSVSLSFSQSIELHGRGISPLEGRYLNTEQYKRRINAHRHPRLLWVSTHDPSVLAGEDGSCLRPRGHCGDMWSLLVEWKLTGETQLLWEMKQFQYNFSTINCTSYLGSNSGLHGGKLAANRLSHSTTFYHYRHIGLEVELYTVS